MFQNFILFHRLCQGWEWGSCKQNKKTARFVTTNQRCFLNIIFSFTKALLVYDVEKAKSTKFNNNVKSFSYNVVKRYLTLNLYYKFRCFEKLILFEERQEP